MFVGYEVLHDSSGVNLELKMIVKISTEALEGLFKDRKIVFLEKVVVGNSSEIISVVSVSVEGSGKEVPRIEGKGKVIGTKQTSNVDVPGT